MLSDVKKVTLINNGLGDEGFVEILAGIRQSDSIKRLDCRGNAVGTKSLLELANILGKFAPEEQFWELSLNHVKIAANHLNSLLEVMGNNCPLRKLSLSRLAFDEISVDWVAKILSRSRSLYSFSLSGSEMLATHLNRILKVLSRNRVLEYLDLSWLPVGSQGEMTVSQVKQEILVSLIKFVQRNRQLIHLDLSYSRLADVQCTEIVEAARKSLSLMSLHLSGNGITDECRAKCIETLKARKMQPEKAMQNEFEEMGLELPQRKNSIVCDKKKKPTKTRMSEEQKYVLWRIKDTREVQLSNVWVDSEACFICDEWRYTVFAYSAELAAKKYLPLKELPHCILASRITIW